MASDSKKNKSNDDAAEESKASASESKPAKGGPKMMLPLIIVAIVLGLGGLGVGGYFLVSHMQAAKAEAAGETTGEATSETPEITNTNIYFNDFPEGIVNMIISDKNPFTYLKYQFSLEVDEEKTLKVLEETLPKLEGKVATVMSNRTWEEISLSKGRDAVAAEVLATINENLPEGRCIGLYFTTFVAQ
jgi:flagellar basal body-associated protein FliL